MKRYPYANVAELKDGKFRAVLGGVPNVVTDLNNNLVPMDNRIIGSPGNTIDYTVPSGLLGSIRQSKLSVSLGMGL